MNLSRWKPSATVATAVVALVVGLEAPAMAHQAKTVAQKICGSKIKPNTITGKQVKESTLGLVPKAKLATKATTAVTATTAVNATELGGKPASAYALATNAFASGLITVPSGVSFQPILTIGPVEFDARCNTAAKDPQVEVDLSPTSQVTLGFGADYLSQSPQVLSSSSGPIPFITQSVDSGGMDARDVLVDAADGGDSYRATVVADVDLYESNVCTVRITGNHY